METIPPTDPAMRQDIVNLYKAVRTLSSQLREILATPSAVPDGAEKIAEGITTKAIPRHRLLVENPHITGRRLDEILAPLLKSGELMTVKKKAPSGKGRPMILYRRWVDRES